ncbi:Flp family type IVb pilin [Hyphomicrobium facile]|uniref:Pilus assembly protein Flp/PilA n=1 Tax=Hyphomicrobium facile TaxID=51670 RepID=A0A1I7MVF8_9HYPH|nr:Flp family type IVb pilin [Hyphomicrobium facile]SFV26378.1 pilus assembly protein Flp/PilA [Hyphomicrobium facile]
MHKRFVRSFLSNESGATSIEYALIAGIVSICIVGALTQISGILQGTFTTIASHFTAANQ